MNPPSPSRSPRWSRCILRVVVALPWLLLGCGVNEYEEKLKNEYTRIQRLDREEKFLGDPLAMPNLSKKDDKEVTWSIFVRPPRGIARFPDKGPLFGGLLARYGMSGSGAFKMVYLGHIGESKEFIKDVLGRFPGSENAKAETVEVETPDRKVVVHRYTFEGDKSTMSANFYPANKPQVAIVYQAEQGKLVGDAAEALRVSLSTLGVDTEADRLRASYNQLRTKPR